MKRTMHNSRVAVLLTTSVLTAASVGVSQSYAADDPPGTEPSASAPVEVDPNDPDLKLPDGATLAQAKVLDIKSVVEEQSGDERREDTNTSVTLALQAEVLFGKDSSKLGAEAKSRIRGIADEIRTQNATRVRVFGFTDDLGSSAHGDVLSKRRANAVHDVLSQSLNDAGITYEVRGYGEQYPIADNSTEAGRKKNRRVEVSFPRTEP
ncbi:outer membrane protein OmpA-like peptidoglycan-associated protein [Streptomyces coelicolor]|nr:outer membrane protein OmpA-like peptidoglycan-associated protein [Streptomyces coelicolor]TYP03735.1 outer membrane protein OmpA-like peptidoglycan-associated protein [Streptomyces coelicolor A3(2)]TYP22675.1 outer membrane protein OmpA-like peptidoglycan-associated protein [Streptomyces coelicolor]TYP22786.1 outer membrane protein OmpA-like peptidoglycan-associated protein [Streptomyces coelicolor]TYP41848.1 outer membrane protein OmpA-like peptidoglycan-associated protein [Streptomyces co